MTSERPAEIVARARGLRMIDEDGDEDVLELLPPLPADDIGALEERIPCPLPAAVRELLEVSAGLANGPLESLEFAGLGHFGMEEIFPCPVPIAHDGFGNYWVVDLVSGSTDWGPILFLCHDPPVVVHQCDDLATFLRETLRLANPPHDSELDRVHEELSMRVWTDNPGMMTVADCRSSGDEALASFAAGLDDSFQVRDLRGARTGDGFSWGRYGPRTVLRRHGDERIFAVQRKGWLRRLLRR